MRAGQMSRQTKLKLIFAESVLCYGALGFVMPVINLFWNSVGMNQTMIGLSQMICTIVMFAFDIPMGYIADRYSRRLLNIAGDFGNAFAFLLYALSRNFWGVIVGEILAGVFMAMTNGVDRAFIKVYADDIDPSGGLFTSLQAKLSACQFASLSVFIAAGMALSRFSVRWCIAAVAFPFLIGGVLALFIDDIGERIEAEHRNAALDMWRSFRAVLKDRRVGVLLVAFALQNNMTHPIIWVFTPLLILSGVPVWLVGLGWFFNYLAPVAGSWIAGKLMGTRLRFRFMTSFILVTCAVLPIILFPGTWTVWLFALTGVAIGFPGVLLLPDIQRSTEARYQTMVVSMGATLQRLIYIPAVFLVNLFANDAPQNALTASLVLFLPFALLLLIPLGRIERAGDAGRPV